MIYNPSLDKAMFDRYPTEKEFLGAALEFCKEYPEALKDLMERRSVYLQGFVNAHCMCK